MRQFLQVFAEKFMQAPKHGSMFEKLRVLAKSMIFVFFHEMRHFLQLFAENFMKTMKHGSLFEKLRVLAKSTTFRVLSRNEALFATFY